MNKLQQTEFNILKEFVKVCEQLELTYYLVCGSALGAVKYRGFIPWDDDIDVALPREDYERFLELSPSLLPDWCFVQNYRTDKNFHLYGTKLRDSRTTYIETPCMKMDIHQGVFIDVFPLDEQHSDPSMEKVYKRLRKKTDDIRIIRLDYRRFTSREVFNPRNSYYILYKLFGLYSDTSKYIGAFDNFASDGNSSGNGIWCNHANSSSPNEFAPKEQYGKGVEATFEGLTVRVPERYDEYLTQKYGDWRADLPPEQQVGHHDYEICDLTRPYTDYIEQLPNGKIRIVNPR